ncbi:MAG: hypothetical protein NTX97_02815 [Bacteroidetes bacterium]|nr:hypothetical protein [Bacteroidota bacterium]
MKKSLLFISAIFIGSLSSTAQITVTTADVASPIKVIYQANDTLPSVALSVGTAGVSQTWNMSMLNTSTTDTLTFVSASWVPNVHFPTSNLVMKQGWQNNYAYMTNAVAGLTSQGFSGTANLGAGPMIINQVNTPSEILMNFPETYLMSFSNNFTQNVPSFYFGVDPGIGFVVDSIRQKSVQQKSVLVDAWGSLTTPLGTYNVLRSKETIVKHDTTDAFLFGSWVTNAMVSADSTTGYTWWAFAVEASKVSSVQMFDVAGRLIDTFTISGDNTSVNISNYANGIYSYAIIGKDQGIINRGKFTVAK